MNKKLLIMSLCLLSFNSYAGISNIKASNNQLGIQFVSSKVDYKETFTDGTLADTEKSWISGFGLSANLMKDVFFR